MKNSFAYLSCLFGITSSLQAASVFSDNFNSYAAANLVGQGGWSQTGTIATSPIQVDAFGQVVLGTSGQDVYSAFGSSATHTDGSAIFASLDITVTAAQSAGDYFFHLSDPVGTTGNFYTRVYAKASANVGFFQLGVASGSGSGSVITYGGDLALGQSLNVVLGWNFISGTANDTLNLYVNPTDSVEANNTAYIGGYTWTGTLAEPSQISAVNFRQGSGSSAPTLVADNINIGTSFSDVVAVPEPASATLLGLGLAACLIRRRN